jgi:acetyl esterase/lipase
LRARALGLWPALASLAAASAAAQLPKEAGPTTYEISALDTAHGDREFVYLWADQAPGALGSEALDRPKLTLYRAPADRANGTAVVVCPGGGYTVVASDHEGRQVAEWLNTLGVSAFVLQYRLGPRYRHPAPLQDAGRAMRLVRARATEWGVQPSRVGILGFSAGGHLASTAGTHFDAGNPAAADPIDRQGSRPDFLILCYPVITFKEPAAHRGSARQLLGPDPDPALLHSLSNETQVTAQTPPTFLWHTDEDTGVPPENSILFYGALRQAKVPAELHVFAKGPHGIGLAPGDPAASLWTTLCANWLRSMGFLAR